MNCENLYAKAPKPKRKSRVRKVGPVFEKYKPTKKFVEYRPKETIFRKKTINTPSHGLEFFPAGEDTPRSDRPVYTGNRLLGIAVMHKSNLVPVFHKEEAIEISTMRRG